MSLLILAGVIYQRKGKGVFSYTCWPGAANSMDGNHMLAARPEWDPFSEAFHIHPERFNNTSNAENFSPRLGNATNDMGWADDNQTALWLITPSGECKRYAPGTKGATPHNGKRTSNGKITDKALDPKGKRYQ
jgi:hypothetical protein